MSSDLIDEMLADLPPASALVASRAKAGAAAAKPAKPAPRTAPDTPATPPSVAAPTAALPPRSPVNWTVWLLLGLNFLVAAAVILYILLSRG